MDLQIIHRNDYVLTIQASEYGAEKCKHCNNSFDLKIQKAEAVTKPLVATKDVMVTNLAFTCPICHEMIKIHIHELFNYYLSYV
jgi:hypothetical protein